VCRYGGEEFCILLKDCDADNASAIAEKIREKIAEHGAHPVSQTPDIRISASFGVCDTHLEPRGIHELLSQADKALYKAKDEGRNRVVSWNSSNAMECLHQTGNV
jgi:two-component system cell cycle response regulator